VGEGTLQITVQDKTAILTLASHLKDQSASPRATIRTPNAIKQRITLITRKYASAKGKKESTGWGAGMDGVTIERKNLLKACRSQYSHIPLTFVLLL
jgi:hypothetical protein